MSEEAAAVSQKKKIIHLGRVLGEVRILAEDGTASQDAIEVRVIFNDLTTEGAKAHSQIPIEKNTRIILSMTEPHEIKISAEVASSQSRPASAAVVSAHRFKYRLRFKFHYAKPEDQKAVAGYIEALRKFFNEE